MGIEDEIAEYRTRVEEEVARHKANQRTEQNPYSWDAFYLNNFAFKLPGGWLRSEDYANQRENPACSNDIAACASERLKGKTRAEFFADIDQAIEMAGLSIQRVEEIQQQNRGQVMPDLYEYVLPAVAVLLWMGYKRDPDLMR